MGTCVGVGTNQRSNMVAEVCSHAAGMGGVALVKNITSLWFVFFSLSLMLSVLRVISCGYLFMQVLGDTCSLLCNEKVMLSALACDTEVTFTNP